VGLIRRGAGTNSGTVVRFVGPDVSAQQHGNRSLVRQSNVGCLSGTIRFSVIEWLFEREFFIDELDEGVTDPLSKLA
jgi:hypothetical protein